MAFCHIIAETCIFVNGVESCNKSQCKKLKSENFRGIILLLLSLPVNVGAAADAFRYFAIIVRCKWSPTDDTSTPDDGNDNDNV